MVKVAEAEGRVIVVIPLRVQLFNAIERELAQLNVLRGGSAALILIGGDIGAESLHVGKAVPSDHDFGPFAFDDFDAAIVGLGTRLAPVPPRVKVVEAASGVRAHALVADQDVGLEARVEGLDGGGRQTKTENE